MSELTVDDIIVIEFQDEIDSYPPRTNTANIKNAVNDNYSQIVDLTTKLDAVGNLVTNGDFATDSGWTKGTGWTISGGVAHKVSGNSNSLQQDGILSAGETYRVTYTITSYTAGTLTIEAGGTSGTARSAAGTYTEEITTASGTYFRFTPNTAGEFSIDNVKVFTASGSEVIAGRDNTDSLQTNIRLRKAFGNRVIDSTSWQVKQQTVADDTVQVIIGSGIIAGIGSKTTVAQNSAAFSSAAAGKHKRVLIVMNSDATAAGLEGSEVILATTPPYPSVSSSQLVLGQFILTEAAVVISDADITDERIIPINPFQDFELLDKEYTYNADGSIDTVVITEKDGTQPVFQFNYTDDLITTVTTTVDSVDYTNTLTYNSDGALTDEVITIDV